MLSMGVAFRRQLLHILSIFGLAAYLLASVSGFFSCVLILLDSEPTRSGFFCLGSASVRD